MFGKAPRFGNYKAHKAGKKANKKAGLSNWFKKK